MKNKYLIVLFSIFCIALMLSFAEPSWAIQQHMTEQEINKKINSAYAKEKNQNSNSKITGMATGKAGGIAMLIIGIIMATVAALWMAGATKLFQGKKCFADPVSQTIEGDASYGMTVSPHMRTDTSLAEKLVNFFTIIPCVKAFPWGPVLCIALLVLGILLIVAGIMLMAKAKEVKSGDREEQDDSDSLNSNVKDQATKNQKDK